MKTVRTGFDKAILKIIIVSLSGNKTTCPEMRRVKCSIDNRLPVGFYSDLYPVAIYVFWGVREDWGLG